MMATASAMSPTTWAVSTGCPNPMAEDSATGWALPLPLGVSVPGSSAIAFVQPGLTGQVAGLIALAVAVLLTVTRLSLRRRFRSRKQASS